ncbi:MAG: CoA pyrophosphatase [Balneolaceae bacterium]
MTDHPFITFLKTRIEKPLPGSDAQKKMLPVPVEESNARKRTAPVDASPSSVLIPIFIDENNQLNVILTLRTSGIRHGGQICFPGGRSEQNEEPLATALRESQEEIGLPPEDVQVIGSITSFYLHHTNNKIEPFIGFLEKKPKLTRNPNEVEEIITVELNILATEDKLINERWNLEHNSFDVPYWNIHKVPLWGATAMIMSELMELYREFLKQD